MDMVVTCVIFYLVFILIDLVPIYKKKQWNYVWFYSIIVLISFTISILDKFDFTIPSPAEPIEKLIRFVFGIKE